MVLMPEAAAKRKDEFYSRAHDEFAKALEAVVNFPEAIFADGRALAHMRQDDAAKAQFQKYIELAPADNPDRQRAQRYIE